MTTNLAELKGVLAELRLAHKEAKGPAKRIFMQELRFIRQQIRMVERLRGIGLAEVK